ncbi:MAG TPA: hypothetical protein VG709_02495 [Actinomycetota bacterium]|nr:hypothetical protein [Actinomycetota bacterium]
MKLRVAALASLLGLLGSSLGSAQAIAETSCPAPKTRMKFAPQTYIDTDFAGGEPTVEAHPDGTLFYGAHAGTTHIFAPAAADEDSTAFVEHYTNQTYIWVSHDDGKTWKFIPRFMPPDNVPGTGFSDPDFAIDKAGQVYASEINLVNVAMSKADDPQHEDFTLQNFFAQTITDRQWSEADQRDVLYLVGNAFGGGTFPTKPAGNFGHFLYKSTDGGRTFSPGDPDGAGLGDLQVDKRNGTLYEAWYDDDVLSMAAFRDARSNPFTTNVQPDLNEIARNVDMNFTAHWPSLDVDDHGNVYIVWSEDGNDGTGARPGGIWYSYSTDAGNTWAAPIQVDSDRDGTDIWPWLAVGAPGRVAISWLEAPGEPLPGNDPEDAGGSPLSTADDRPWVIEAAQTLNGLGCRSSSVPGFRTVVATPDPVHRGTICRQGTICQAQLIDRRMGDYFSIEINEQGHMFAGYSDTRQGGMVALPGYVRQVGGPVFQKPPSTRVKAARR